MVRRKATSVFHTEVFPAEGWFMSLNSSFTSFLMLSHIVLAFPSLPGIFEASCRDSGCHQSGFWSMISIWLAFQVLVLWFSHYGKGDTNEMFPNWALRIRSPCKELEAARAGSGVKIEARLAVARNIPHINALGAIWEFAVVQTLFPLCLCRSLEPSRNLLDEVIKVMLMVEFCCN